MHPGNVTVNWFSPTCAPSHPQTSTNEKEEEDQEEVEEEKEQDPEILDLCCICYKHRFGALRLSKANRELVRYY